MTDPDSSSGLDPTVSPAVPASTGSDGDLGGVDLGRVWTGVAAEVWRRHPGPVERLAARLLRSPGLARALLTTPSLLLPWLISTRRRLRRRRPDQLRRRAAARLAARPRHRRDRHRLRLRPRRRPGLGAGLQHAGQRADGPARPRGRRVRRQRVPRPRGQRHHLLRDLAGARRGGHAAAAGAAITVAWLLPMTAVCALTLAVAVTARSAGGRVSPGCSPGLATVFASGLGQRPLHRRRHRHHDLPPVPGRRRLRDGRHRLRHPDPART